MKKFLKIKSELKDFANQIKTLKVEHKTLQKENGGAGIEYKVANATDEFRYLHVAYCLVRGRKYEEIERPKPHNKLNPEKLSQCINRIIEENKCRMYVLVDKSLPAEQKAVQAAHAVAEYYKVHGAKTTYQWNNHLIILESDKILDTYFLRKYKMDYAVFNEPFYKGKITAIAFLLDPEVQTEFHEKFIQKMQLMKLSNNIWSKLPTLGDYTDLSKI